VPIKAERSIEPKALKEKFVNSGPTTVCLNIRSAIEQSLKLEGVNRVVIFGSFYTIAAASKIIKKI
jgi:dihydrofolate synthase/folylpolyglutamate synthase